MPIRKVGPDRPRHSTLANCAAGRILAWISHTVAGFTEANVVTGKEKTAGRIGNTAKGFDAACRHKRPALRVARGGSPGASKPSTLEHDGTRLNHSDGAVLGQGQAKARTGVPGVRARGFAPDLAQKRPSLRAFDRRPPDAEPVSSDAPHRTIRPFRRRLATTIAKQN